MPKWWFTFPVVAIAGPHGVWLMMLIAGGGRWMHGLADRFL